MNANNSFKQLVYQLIKKIPKGKVTTYGQIAEKVKSSPREAGQSPKSKSILARAVGNALHQNIDPSIPCHRVVNKDGRLALNYSFGGWQKQRQKLLSEGVKFKDERHVDASSFKDLRAGSRCVF